MTPNRKKAYLYLIVTSIIWGAALPVVKSSLVIITAFQFLFLRFLVASPLLLPIAIKNHLKQPLSFNKYFQLIIFSLIESVALICLYLGLTITTSIEASLITNIQPVIITVAGIFLLHEREERNEVLGLILALIGSLVIVLEPIINQHSQLSFTSMYGSLLVLSWAILTSASGLLIKKYASKISKFTISTANSITTLLLLTFILFITSGFPTMVQIAHPSTLFAILYMGILGTVIAFTLFYKGYQLIEASEATLFSYLQPLIYVPLGVFWLKERISVIQIASLATIVVGVYIAEKRKSSKPNRS